MIIRKNIEKFKNIWPIDKNMEIRCSDWVGWPDGKKFAVVLTHDVESGKGQDRCISLAAIESGYGFYSSFNFVPERYIVSQSVRARLVEKGFEIGVHDLNHDGLLFQSKLIFDKRAPIINKYLHDWDAKGFRSGAMFHNLEWIGKLDIKYDCSTFDTDPFEPQSDGVGKIYPYWVQTNKRSKGFVELPYTLPQDFTLFILMQMKDISIWKQKIDWIAQNGGMVLVNVHPDYINFNNNQSSDEEYPVKLYTDLLMYLKTKYKEDYWHALPGDVAEYIKKTCGVGIKSNEDLIIN
jgi:hypothetical protein